MAVPQSKVVPIRKCTRWPSWRQAAPGTGLLSPRNTVARIDLRNEAMTEHILEMVKSQPLYSRDTAIKIGCGQKNVNYHLNKLKNRGQVVYEQDTRRWVLSNNRIIRDQAASQIDDLIEDMKPILNKRTLSRIARIGALLRDPMHY